MRMNWERLGITVVVVLMITGVFVTAIYLDPTGFFEKSENFLDKTGAILANVIIIALTSVLGFMLLAGICTGIWNVFCWIIEEPEQEQEEPAPEPETPLGSISDSIPESIEEISRTSLLDLS